MKLTKQMINDKLKQIEKFEKLFAETGISKNKFSANGY